MGRIRTIKPEFFKHEGLYDAERETGLPLRVAFAGLWTQCDREGRFKWRPRALKSDILPFDEVDFSRVLHALTTRGFIVFYTHENEHYGFIPSWHVHQVINNREAASELPAPTDESIDLPEQYDASSTRAPRENDACPTRHGNCKAERKGKEGEREREKDYNNENARARKETSLPERANHSVDDAARQRYDNLEAALRRAAGDSLNTASPSLLVLAEPMGWIDSGADLERDILPAIRARAAGLKPKSVRSWGYFAGAVREWRDRRMAGLKPAPDGSAVAAAPPAGKPEFDYAQICDTAKMLGTWGIGPQWPDPRRVPAEFIDDELRAMLRRTGYLP